MPSILIICTANLYRSPLAVAFLREQLNQIPGGEDCLINSAGTWTKIGTPIHSQTLIEAQRVNVDISQHKSQQVTADLLAQSDLVLVMEAGHKEALTLEFPQFKRKIFILSEVVDGISYSIPDPFSAEGKHDQNISDELHGLIERGAGKILSLAKKMHSHPPTQSVV